MNLEHVRYILWIMPLASVVQVLLFLRLWKKLKPERRAKLDFRFDLTAMVLSMLVYAAVLACIRYFLLVTGMVAEDIVPITVMLFPTVLLGMFSGRANQRLISERAPAMRWLAYLLGVLYPICAGPGIVATILMALNLNCLRNDSIAMIGWLFLLFPCLGQFWFYSVYRIRRDDKPLDGSQ